MKRSLLRTLSTHPFDGSVPEPRTVSRFHGLAGGPGVAAAFWAPSIKDSSKCASHGGKQWAPPR